MKQLTPWKVKYKLRREGGWPRQKGQSGNKEWEDDKIFTLIHAWSVIEQLFYSKHLRDEKMKSLEKIKGILHENGIKVTVKQIMNKIHLLRNNYSDERCREEAASKKSCSAQDDFGPSKCLFFNLSLLRNNLIPQVTEKNWKQPQMEIMQNPRGQKTSRPVLGKMSIQRK